MLPACPLSEGPSLRFLRAHLGVFAERTSLRCSIAGVGPPSSRNCWCGQPEDRKDTVAGSDNWRSIEAERVRRRVRRRSGTTRLALTWRLLRQFRFVCVSSVRPGPPPARNGAALTVVLPPKRGGAADGAERQRALRGAESAPEKGSLSVSLPHSLRCLSFLTSRMCIFSHRHNRDGFRR